MATPVSIKKEPFKPGGRALFALVVGELIALWLLTIFAVNILPTTVAVHFNYNGLPDLYGNSATYLLVGALMSLAPLIILLVVYFRYELMNDYPYLINIPYFLSKVERTRPRRRGYWVNRYFEVYLAIGAYISSVLLIIMMALLVGSRNGYLSGVGVIVAAVVSIFIVLLGWLLFISGMSRTMDVEIRGQVAAA